nr:sulfatase [Phytoactinopolyspora alkaliphila]
MIHCHDVGTFLSCYGMRSVASPHIHRLAEESVVFDRAFSTAPLCTPARSSLFTGLSPHVNGLMGLAHAGWRYRAGVQTLPELLEREGYHTTLVGLQHEHPDPTVLGFGEVRGIGFLPRALPVADEAERWLRDRPERRRPYFLTVGMWEAHRPWRREDYPPVDPGGIEVPDFLPDNEHTREDLSGFFGAIRQLDEAVGRVVHAVDRFGDPENTFIVFTTDHGSAFPRAKGTLYDPGVQVPLIVRPPKGWSGSPGRRSRLVSHLDLVPTFMELAGGEPSDRWEGRSLVDDLRGADGDDGRAVFFQKTFHDTYDPMRAVRTSRYKLIRNFTEGPRLVLSKDIEESPTRRGMGDAHLAPRPPVEVYDLQDDPAEQRDVAALPEFADLVAELSGRLDQWMARTGDPLLSGTVPPPPRPSRLQDAYSNLGDVLRQDA